MPPTLSVSRFGYPLLTLVLLILMPARAPAIDYQLVWQDEFSGTEVDTSLWEFQIGDGCSIGLCGWGNNELQYYRSENATVSGGLLTITAREESFGGRDYTSSRLRTKNRGDWTHGRFEIRAKMPVGKGLWPAFWMLSTNQEYGTWAATGEIDILEYLGDDTDRVFGTLHYGAAFPGNVFSSNDFVLGAGTFADDFHTFELEWDPYEIRWFVDGAQYAAQNEWWSTGGPFAAPFDVDFHLLLNMAVGGNLPGSPDGSTMFPQELVVDYVRVYQGTEFPDCRVVFDNMSFTNPFAKSYFVFNGAGSGTISSSTSTFAPGRGCCHSLDAAWSSFGSTGFLGGFGRTFPVDLTDMTHFEFWIDPDPGQNFMLEVNLQDDDNGDNSIPGSPDGNDDEFQYDVSVGGAGSEVIAGGGWQRVSIPLTSFYDDPSFHWGGNGVFDPFVNGNGQLVNVVFAMNSISGADASFRTDSWQFTREEGSIAGIIWNDGNANGVQNGGEPGLAGVTVFLEDSTGARIDTTATATFGIFQFGGTLPASAYEVIVDETTLPGAGTPTFDTDGIGTPHVSRVILACAEANQNQNFGYSFVSTGVIADGAAPRATLFPNVPNPFNPTTRIAFESRARGRAVLEVFDVNGRRVATLLDEERAAGRHSVAWSGEDAGGRPVPSGVYFYRLKTDAGVETRRMVLIR